MIVVIDPGHGGNQPGTVRHGLRECDVNLAVARLIPPLLNGYEVSYTRTADVSLVLGYVVDAVVGELNEILGHDWVGKVEEVKGDIEDLLPWLQLA